MIIAFRLKLLLLVCAFAGIIQGKRFDERFISQEELYDLILEAQREQNNSEINLEDLQEIRALNPKTSWTFIVYMAADNDLHYFAWKNLKQMEQIGSNSNISIIVQLNTPGYLNPTKRYIIKKGRRVLVQDSDDFPQQKLNSGSGATLVNCVSWAVSHYPADNYGLILWNHGTGEVDPYFTKTINPCELFYLNPTDQKLEIDRGTSYLALICQELHNAQGGDNTRGICFDDTFKSYLSNHDLEAALFEIQNKILGGKKLSLIGFDACLMSMIGVASICKRYAQYFVGSQEIEYGTGWNYTNVLEPFTKTTLDPKSFASHIVLAYEQTYSKLINDYTLSAMDLEHCAALEQNVHNIAHLLHEALINQYNHTVSDIIRKCKSTQYCTCFDEPSYIDIGHFYNNLLQHVSHFSLKDKQQEASIKQLITQALTEGLAILPKLIIQNKVGPKLKNAQGISIYFPEHNIAQSYLRSPFALKNNWCLLLSKYILG